MLSWSKTINKLQIKIKVLSLINSLRRVSFSSSFYLRAGMALEGCLVLPVFLFFMGTLLYSFEMVRFQSDVYEAMHQTGSRLCFYAYESKYGKGEMAYTSNLYSAPEAIKGYLEDQFLPYLCVEGGRAGVSVAADIDNYGNIEINTDYSIKPFIRWLPIGNIKMKDRFFGHSFVGYMGDGDTEGGNGEIFVYITATGAKYHFSEECTYLKIKIKSSSEETIGSLRNNSGEKYYPCEQCNPAGQGLVYLTEWGNRYHGEADCAALKRTVYIIPLSEAGDRTACSKCG